MFTEFVVEELEGEGTFWELGVGWRVMLQWMLET
jgi:hypothetical protein